MNNNYSLFLSIVLTAILCTASSCGQQAKKNIEEIVVFSDISFHSIVEEQLAVFTSSFGRKQLTKVVYKTESDCFQTFLNDSSVKMIITSRALHENEKVYLKQKKVMFSPSIRIAYDAIAIVLHPDRKDTLFTQQDIKEMLTKKSNDIVVVEGKTASSTLLSLIQKLDILPSQLRKNLIGLQDGDEVLQFVRKHPKAIGLVGISTINKIDKLQQQTFSNRGFKIASILDQLESKKFIKPYLTNIANGYYPFIREMYYTVKEVESGPGLRFGRFMSNERGQLIFKRSYLLPARMDFRKRAIQIKEK